MLAERGFPFWARNRRMGNLASSFAGCVENVGASVSDLFVYSSIVAIFISIKLSICLSINRDLSIVIYLSSYLASLLAIVIYRDLSHKMALISRHRSRRSWHPRRMKSQRQPATCSRIWRSISRANSRPTARTTSSYGSFDSLLSCLLS